MHRRLRHDEGTALIEMAIVLPLLLLLILGLVETARGFNARSSLVHATREGVREFAITEDGDAAITATLAAATTLDPALVTVTPSGCADGEPARVTASYPFTYSIPFFGSGTIDITTSAVMRCGG